ncbi:MAG: DUF4242 domain-containing protein [Acidimicrobiia bacterium]
MPLYLIERNFAEQLGEIAPAEVDGIRAVNADENVRWLLSFLSADRKKTYCLYEAPDPDAIRAAARQANLPADVIVEVSELNPELISPTS